MYAVVEFLDHENESAGEIAVVPICWLQKNDTKCYWPITTRKRNFSDFIKEQTPYKSTWPCYKVYKVHLKTSSYDDAETKIEEIIYSVQSDSNASFTSNRSQMVRKVPSKIAVEETPEKNSFEKNDNCTPIGNSQKARKRVLSDSSEDDLNTVNGTNNNDTTNASMEPATYESFSTESVKSTLSSNFPVQSTQLDQIATHLSGIKTILDQHSVILSRLQASSVSASGALNNPPVDLPDFPMKSNEEFVQLDGILKENEAARTYMMHRLSAVGGSGLESLTRRILKFLFTNEVAQLYNWKGREKLSFEKTVMISVIRKIQSYTIVGAVKLSFPVNEQNDFMIENAVKDWLKYAKIRMKRKAVIII